MTASKASNAKADSQHAQGETAYKVLQDETTFMIRQFFFLATAWLLCLLLHVGQTLAGPCGLHKMQSVKVLEAIHDLKKHHAETHISPRANHHYLPCHVRKAWARRQRRQNISESAGDMVIRI